MNTKKWLTVPNLLSVFRIVLIPVFVLVFLESESDTIAFWPIAVLVLSGLTDLCDGFIARKFNQVSDVGKMLDPAADKLTQAAVIACLSIRFPSLLILLIIYVVKELSMLIGGVVLLKYKKQVPAAKWYGKVSTFEMYTAMLLFLLFPNMTEPYVTILLAVSAALVLFACLMYLFNFFILHTKKGETK